MLNKVRLMLLGLTVGLLSLGNAAQAESLRILTWEGYADKDWVEEFEKANNVDVDVVFVGEDSEIWAKVQGSQGADADIIVTNAGQMQRYIDAKLIQPLDTAKIPNLKNLLPAFQDLSKVPGATRDGKTYLIPFAYGPYMLMWNPEIVKEAPNSWAVLWDPAYKGKVLTHDSYEYNFTVAAIADGATNPYQLTDEQLAKYKERLIELKRQLLNFYQFPDEVVQLWQNNEVAVMVAAYGPFQVKALEKAGLKVGAVIPKEGSPAWLDTMAVTVGATGERLDLAYKWIDFAISKKISQQLAERTNFGTTGFETGLIKEGDKIFWVAPVENPTKRSDLWNEIKATP